MRPTLTTSDGLRLSGRRWRTIGTPSAAVVIVHGMAASADCPHVEALAESIHRSGVRRRHVRRARPRHLRRRVDARRRRTARCRGRGLAGARAHGSSRARRRVHGRGRGGPLRDDRSRARRRRPRVVPVAVEAAAQRPRRARGGDDAHRVPAACSCPASPASGSRRSGRTRCRRSDSSPSSTCRSRSCTGGKTASSRASDAAELYAAAPEPRRLTMVPRMGHAFGPDAIEPVRDAIDWALAIAAPAGR